MIWAFRLLAVLLLAIVHTQAQDTVATSRPGERSESHWIAIKVTWDGAVIVEANEVVRSLEAVRRLIGTIGDGVYKRLEMERASGDLYPRVVTAIDVSASFPLSWLQAAIFDVESQTNLAEVGQEQFLQTVAHIVLSIDGTLARCPIRPFMSIGLARDRRAASLEKVVLAGLAIGDRVSERDEVFVILGPAGVEAPNVWVRTWIGTTPSPGTESRPTATLSDGSSPTAADLAAASIRARQSGAGSRPTLETSHIEEVRGAEIIVAARERFGKRAHVVDPTGSMYVGTIEIVGFSTIPGLAPISFKIVERSRSPGAPAFAAGQLVVFQPE